MSLKINMSQGSGGHDPDGNRLLILLHQQLKQTQKLKIKVFWRGWEGEGGHTGEGITNLSNLKTGLETKEHSVRSFLRTLIAILLHLLNSSFSLCNVRRIYRWRATVLFVVISFWIALFCKCPYRDCSKYTDHECH